MVTVLLCGHNVFLATYAYPVCTVIINIIICAGSKSFKTFLKTQMILCTETQNKLLTWNEFKIQLNELKVGVNFITKSWGTLSLVSPSK